jgi:hypothetical protein
MQSFCVVLDNVPNGDAEGQYGKFYADEHMGFICELVSSAITMVKIAAGEALARGSFFIVHAFYDLGGVQMLVHAANRITIEGSRAFATTCKEFIINKGHRCALTSLPVPFSLPNLLPVVSRPTRQQAGAF